jgi:hypothetical protein
VQRLIAISFITIQLLATSVVGEILKLPLLIHHYLEHREKEPDESIIQFLREHYTELHTTLALHHANDHKHLPLKMMDKGNLSSSSSIVPQVSIVAEPCIFRITTVISMSSDTAIYSHFLADIWQPPKV